MNRKGSHMKKILFASIIASIFAFRAMAFEFNIDPTQTGSILVTSTASTPTQIFTNDPSAMRTYILNLSTANIFIVGFSTTGSASPSTAGTISTSLASGSFFIPPSTGSIQNFWSPDGVNDPYRGPMWATASGATGAVIQRFRAH